MQDTPCGHRDSYALCILNWGIDELMNVNNFKGLKVELERFLYCYLWPEQRLILFIKTISSQI